MIKKKIKWERTENWEEENTGGEGRRRGKEEKERRNEEEKERESEEEKERGGGRKKRGD